LEIIEAILLLLQDFKSDGRNHSQVNAIRTQTQSLGEGVGRFLVKVKRYEQTLGWALQEAFIMALCQRSDGLSVFRNK
jgi:hypothetical protein